MRSYIGAIPIRLRLALGFATVMAVVLAAIGLYIYDRTDSDLDARIDRELAARLAGVVAIVRDDGDDLGDPVHDPLGRVDAEGIVQVVGPGGEVADATDDALLGRPLLSRGQLADLLHGGGHIDTESPVGRLRVTAERVVDDRVRYVAIVGASLAEHDGTLASLRRLLLIGGPIALVLASLAAYLVATAALRPVEAMRRRASEIGSADPGLRLPVGPAEDEIASLGRTLNGMLARLEAAIERERRLVADAGHELRTPLTILKAEIELALADARDEERLRGALRSGGEEVDRLSRLADDLLFLARADDGRLPLRSEPVAIEPLARKIAAARSIGPGDRPVTVDVPAGLKVEADPQRLEQALSNLVDNAIRHGAGEIAISARRAGERVEMSVADAGPGFSSELLERATERFARAADPGARGAGLGLAIAESIAVAHGGAIAVANRDRGGAIVTLSLPATAPAAVVEPSQRL